MTLINHKIYFCFFLFTHPLHNAFKQQPNEDNKSQSKTESNKLDDGTEKDEVKNENQSQPKGN